MPTRRTLLFLAASTFMTPCCGAAARAADAAATAFVTKVYDAYKGKNSKGYSSESEADIRRTFEPSLAALIIKDEKAAAKRKEAPALEFDPFVDGQERELSALSIAVTDTPPNKAVVTVSFSTTSACRRRSCSASSRRRASDRLPTSPGSGTATRRHCADC
jgi:hypothetical protein